MAGAAAAGKEFVLTEAMVREFKARGAAPRGARGNGAGGGGGAAAAGGRDGSDV